MTFEIQTVSEIDLPQLADEMYMDPNYLKRVREMTAKDELVIFAAKDGERYVGRCSLWLALWVSSRKIPPDAGCMKSLVLRTVSFHRQKRTRVFGLKRKVMAVNYGGVSMHC